jgi:hypothetical protein
VDGTNFNVYEEADDLSDALALFIAKPKLFAQVRNATVLIFWLCFTFLLGIFVVYTFLSCG